jgi:hypothetical protein
MCNRVYNIPACVNINVASDVGAAEAPKYMVQFIDLIRQVLHDRHQQHHHNQDRLATKDLHPFWTPSSLINTAVCRKLYISFFIHVICNILLFREVHTFLDITHRPIFV